MNGINIHTNHNRLTAKTVTTREVILMNLISSIKIKNQTVREAASGREKVNRQKDYGHHLYHTLEFGKNKSYEFQDHLNLDLLSSRLR